MVAIPTYMYNDYSFIDISVEGFAKTGHVPVQFYTQR